MKTIILSLIAITGCSVAGFAQGTITFDGSNNTGTAPDAATSGRVFLGDVGTQLDTFRDINAELLYSVTGAAGTYSPVVTLSTSAYGVAPTGPSLGQVIDATGDITYYGNGTLSDPSGQYYVIPGVAAGQTAYFMVEAWLGNYSSYDQALASQDIDAYPGMTYPFSEVLSSANSLVQANIENMPGLEMGYLDYRYPPPAMPEPSTFEMAGVGIGSMLILGCRKMIRLKSMRF